MDIHTITVIGANGTMGCNIAGIFASFGNCKVYMVGRDISTVENAALKAALSVRGDSILRNLIPKDYSQLSQCIQDSELIFESIVEDLQVKREINYKIAKNVQPWQIVCTGTSGLSIENLAGCFTEEMKQRYLGVHFFNPPYNMTLCEIIPGKYTDRELVKELRNYMEQVLVRTTVEVKDTPAFLGNRIGFQFINQAMQYAEKYKYNGGIDYIDAILGPFTGRSMPPIETADFVGLDIHKAIVDHIHMNTNDYAKDSFVLPEYADRIIQAGNLGRKAGKGLYQSVEKEAGERKKYVYDILKGEYREVYHYSFPFAEDMILELRNGNYGEAFESLKNNQSEEAKLCMRFILDYIVYALAITDEIGGIPSDADDVMAAGFHWIPPLAFVEALGGRTETRKLSQKYLSEKILNKIGLERLFRQVDQSKYDYRKYLRAKP